MRDLGWLCPKCSSYHAPPECGHDPTRPCRFCTRPVGPLSTGGPTVCSLCEVRGVPFDVYTGRRPAYDFHSVLSGLHEPPAIIQELRGNDQDR